MTQTGERCRRSKAESGKEGGVKGEECDKEGKLTMCPTKVPAPSHIRGLKVMVCSTNMLYPIR